MIPAEEGTYLAKLVWEKEPRLFKVKKRINFFSLIGSFDLEVEIDKSDITKTIDCSVDYSGIRWIRRVSP